MYRLVIFVLLILIILLRFYAFKKKKKEEEQKELEYKQVIAQTYLIARILSDDYLVLFYANTKSGKYSTFRNDDKEIGELIKKYPKFSDMLWEVSEAIVLPEDKPKLFEFLSSVKKEIQTKTQLAVQFRRTNGEFLELTCAKNKDDEQSPICILVGLRCLQEANPKQIEAEAKLS